MADARSRDFTEGAVPAHLIKLTGYMVLGLISVMGAGLIETIYVGRVGTNELAAIGFTFPLVYMLHGLTMGLGVGASSVVARAMGVGDREKARRLNAHAFVLVSLLIFVFAIASYLSLEPFFIFLGASEEVLPLIVDYMTIWLLGLPFFTFGFVGSTLMRAMGDAVSPGYLMFIGSALHVLIAPFFIFGLMGAPELGLAGAALGYVLARFISFLIYIYIIVFRDKIVIFSMSGFLESSRDILHVGLPAIASNLIAPVSMTVVTKLLAAHGAVVVAGFGVASRIEALVVMVIWALSMSIAPFIGQNWGAGKFDRVKRALSLSNGFVLVWGIVAYALLFFFARFFVALINDDAEVVAAAVTYLLIVPLSIGFMGVMSVSTSTFNALGRPMPPLVLSVLQMIVIYLPLALLGDSLLGYTGIYIASATTVTLVGTLSWFWIRREISAGIRRRNAID